MKRLVILFLILLCTTFTYSTEFPGDTYRGLTSTSSGDGPGGSVLFEDLPWIDVRESPYDVICNGAMDATDGIQAAIAALPTGGGTILLPNGTCLVDEELLFDGKAGVTLQGQGSELNATSGGTILIWKGDASTALIRLYGSQFIRLKDFAIYANASFPLLTAIVSETKTGEIATQGMIENVQITSPDSSLTNGVKLITGSGGDVLNDHFKFEDVRITGYTGIGITIDHAQSIVHTFINTRLNGNRAGASSTGVKATAGSQIVFLGGSVNGHTAYDFDWGTGLSLGATLIGVHSENSNGFLKQSSGGGTTIVMGGSFSNSAQAIDSGTNDFRVFNVTQGASGALNINAFDLVGSAAKASTYYYNNTVTTAGTSFVVTAPSGYLVSNRIAAGLDWSAFFTGQIPATYTTAWVRANQLSLNPITQTVADNGGGTAASATVTQEIAEPLGNLLLACNDPDGNNITLAEPVGANVRDGQVLLIYMSGSFPCTILDIANQVDLLANANMTYGVGETAFFIYRINKWVEWRGGNPILVDATDPTKQLKFDLTGLDTATLAILAFDADGDIATTSLPSDLSYLGVSIDLTTEITGTLPIANGGTGSATKNFVDLTTTQTIAGAKTFTDPVQLPIVSGNQTCPGGGVWVNSSAGVIGYCNGSTVTTIDPVTFNHTYCKDDVVAADDNRIFFTASEATTITAIACKFTGTGTTEALFTLEDDDGNAMTITGTNPACEPAGTEAAFAAVTAGNTLISGESLRFDQTATTNPTTDDYCITVRYTTP